MDSPDARKRTLKRDYLLQGRQAGIFRIVNTASGRSLIGSSLDVRAALNRYEFELTRGGHRNRDLQEDFDRLGRDAFAFETVELVGDTADQQETALELDLLEEGYAAALDLDTVYNSSRELRVPPRRR